MSNKLFLTILAVIIAGFTILTLVNKNQPEQERPGVALPDNGTEHLDPGETIEYGGPEPPASGRHNQQPLPWGVFDQEVPDETAIHNLEHGGVYISYRPDLPREQIDRLESLFREPYAREDFAPTKAVVAPRAANGSLIILTSWIRNLKLEKYDEEAIVEYYLQNLGKSPEPLAS
ncbi:MAG TPA: DUF3105 domain-containing protein [Candidatus Saccharimonadales bacterium]|jgi:hypothetical protein